MHNVEYYTYPENCNHQKVYDELNAHVKRATWGEGGHGLEGIRWRAPLLESYEAARTYIEENDNGWYDQLAVRYKEYPIPKEIPKSVADLRRRLSDGRDRLNKITDAAKIQSRTSEKIGCPKCCSQLALKYLRGQICPVCGTDLRSPTNLDRINKAKQNIDSLEKQLAEAEQKEARKAKPKVMWLVKIEYHT